MILSSRPEAQPPAPGHLHEVVPVCRLSCTRPLPSSAGKEDLDSVDTEYLAGRVLKWRSVRRVDLI